MKTTILKKVKPLLTVVLFITFSTVFYFFSPDTLLQYMGFQSAYVIMFFLAFLGGLSTFSGIPYHVVLIAFASSGLNPFLLGLLATSGVMLGDATSYYLGTQSKDLLTEHMQSVLHKLKEVENRTPRLMTILFFLYGALVPFSNDIIVIPSGILGYAFWRVMIPLGIGTLIFNFGLSLIAAYFTQFVSVFL